MLDVLFGRQRSVIRKVCMALAGVLVMLGVALAVADAPVRGLLIAVLGVLSAVVLARGAASRADRAAATATLGQLEDADPERLREWVTRTRHVTEGPLDRITGEIRREDLTEAAREANEGVAHFDDGSTTPESHR